MVKNMAKIKQISFVMNETDNIVIKAKEISEEYQIPLNSALKVLFINLIKENNSLKEQLLIKPIMNHNISSPIEVKSEKQYSIEVEKEKVPIDKKVPLNPQPIINKEKNEDLNPQQSSKATDFANMLGFGG